MGIQREHVSIPKDYQLLEHNRLPLHRPNNADRAPEHIIVVFNLVTGVFG